MATSIEKFENLELSGQQQTSSFGYAEDKPFPLALQTAAGWNPSLEEVISHLETLSKTRTIFDSIQRHGGALLIRGLPIKTAEDYSRIAHAFGFSPHEEVGRPPVRTVLAK